MSVREDILKTTADLFLNYGFKSVTMDDIANTLGMSKKTLYQNFKNKSELVEAATNYMFTIISNGITCVCDLKKNPIEELFEINELVLTHLKNEKASPQFQLQKYYPKIYENLKRKQFNVMQECSKQNLKRGIELGYYRNSIDVDVISKIYFNNVVSLKDKTLFPLNNYTMKTLMNIYLEYHLRAVSTPKGIKHLTHFLSTKKEHYDAL